MPDHFNIDLNSKALRFSEKDQELFKSNIS